MGRRFLLGVGLLVLLLGSVVREYLILPKEAKFYVAEQVFIARVSGVPLLRFGNNLWFEDLIASRFRSWFWEPAEFSVEDFEIGKVYVWPGAFLVRVSESLIVLEVDAYRFLLFLGTENLSEAFAHSVDYAADFWVVWNSDFISGFPIPSEGVLYLTGRNPTEKWQKWAGENEVPLVPINAHNSLQILRREDQWILAPE